MAWPRDRVRNRPHHGSKPNPIEPSGWNSTPHNNQVPATMCAAPLSFISARTWQSMCMGQMLLFDGGMRAWQQTDPPKFNTDTNFWSFPRVATLAANCITWPFRSTQAIVVFPSATTASPFFNTYHGPYRTYVVLASAVVVEGEFIVIFSGEREPDLPQSRPRNSPLRLQIRIADPTEPKQTPPSSPQILQNRLRCT